MIPLKIKMLITIVTCLMVTSVYGQSATTVNPCDSTLILHNIISYHIRHAVEGDIPLTSNGLLIPNVKSIFQKLMPADGQLETEIMPYNGDLSYPDKDYQLLTIHLPGFKVIRPDNMSITTHLHAFRFDDDYLIAYNPKNASIKYISGNFFKSPIAQDFELDNNRPESFFSYLRLRCYAMNPGNISFRRKDEKGIYFTVYSNILNIDAEVFIGYNDHETVKVTDSRLEGSIIATGTKFCMRPLYI